MGKLLDIVHFKDASNWSVAHLMESQFNYNKDYELVRIGNFLTRNKNRITIEDDVEYKRVTIRMKNKGIALRDKVMGRDIGTKKQFLIKKGQFLLSKIDARNGAFGLATDEVHEAIITADFFAYEIDKSKIEPYFLVLLTTTKQFQKFAQGASSGTTGRQRIDERSFLDVKIPLPSLDKQKEIVEAYQRKDDLAVMQEIESNQKIDQIEQYLYEELKIVQKKESNKKILHFIDLKSLTTWSYKDLINGYKIQSATYLTIQLINNISYFNDVFRGKSPKYDKNSNYFILNQKCIRWNDIELQHKKSVLKDWFIKIDKQFFTKRGDILINSTGDGTIGRSSIITNEFEELIYDSHILLLRVNEEKINPLFLVYFINSSLGQKQIENIKSAVATKQTELGITNLKKMQFILPPLYIQNKISKHIQTIKDEITELKEKAEENRVSALQEFEKGIFSEA